MGINKDFEVIIIGGSYAGLSAALALGRSLRRVLVIDGGKPCNRQTPHSHNFLTQDGETPRAISEKAKAQVMSYETVNFVDGLAVSGKRTDNGFSITTDAGDTFTGKKLIFATGIRDIMPEIKGFAECWGISVIHCPYCHGYEYRGKQTGILANGDRAVHLASLVKNLTGDVAILTSDEAEFSPEQLGKLRKHNIEVVEQEIVEIEHDDGHLKNVVFKDGTVREFDAVYAALPFEQHSDIPVSLGCELNENGYITVDSFQKTNIEGVFACGDNTAMMRSVANAVYTGNLTGAMVNKELVEEQF